MKVIFVTREGYDLAGARVRCFNFAKELKRRGFVGSGWIWTTYDCVAVPPRPSATPRVTGTVPVAVAPRATSTNQLSMLWPKESAVAPGFVPEARYPN